MNRLLQSSLLTAVVFMSPVQAEIGLSVNLGEPGFFGPIDIVGFPQPEVIDQAARIITESPANREPAYLRVPPGHAKHWEKHCHEYGACDRPVYFVSDAWYDREYVPRYQEKHGRSGNNKHADRDNQGKGKAKGH